MSKGAIMKRIIMCNKQMLIKCLRYVTSNLCSSNFLLSSFAYIFTYSFCIHFFLFCVYYNKPIYSGQMGGLWICILFKGLFSMLIKLTKKKEEEEKRKEGDLRGSKLGQRETSGFIGLRRSQGLAGDPSPLRGQTRQHLGQHLATALLFPPNNHSNLDQIPEQRKLETVMLLADRTKFWVKSTTWGPGAVP